MFKTHDQTFHKKDIELDCNYPKKIFNFTKVRKIKIKFP